MDTFVIYTKSLVDQGLDAETIQNDLLSRGLDRHTASRLIASAQQVNNRSFYEQLPSTPPKSSGTSWLSRAVEPSAATVSDDIGRPQTQSVFRGYLFAIIVCLIPTLFIAFDAPFMSRFGSWQLSLLTISDIVGMVGLCLYVLDLLLTTRVAWLEDWFGGLNKVYIAHAIFGGSALIAIMLHPLLIALRQLPLGAGAAAAFFVPSLTHIPRLYGQIGLYMMLTLLVITLYLHLPYRLWLASHKLLGLTYVFICLHVLYAPNIITDNLVMRGYVIALAIVGLAAFTYRTLLPNIFVKRYKYVIESVNQKASGVIQISMQPMGKTIHYRAGQFIFISFQADGLSREWHPFSIASAQHHDSLRVDIKSLGAYTETMTRLLPHMAGMTAYVEGAYGRFSYRNVRNVNQVWIAAGIGITPFLSMAQSLGHRPYNIDLYYSARSESEFIDLEVLARRQSKSTSQVFRVVPFETEKYQRYLTADVIAATSGDLAKRDFLICGPPKMMKTMRQQLLARGVSKYRIHSEEFSIV